MIESNFLQKLPHLGSKIATSQQFTSLLKVASLHFGSFSQDDLKVCRPNQRTPQVVHLAPCFHHVLQGLLVTRFKAMLIRARTREAPPNDAEKAAMPPLRKTVLSSAQRRFVANREIAWPQELSRHDA